MDGLWGIPSPRSIGIANLAENFEVIHGAQEFRGKILSRKDLGPIEQFLFTRFRLGYDVLSASRSARTEVTQGRDREHWMQSGSRSG